jgi:hypothetical protein
MTPYLAPIVEGQGEVSALPKLIHRIAREANPACVPLVNHPIRIKSGSFLNDHDYFHRHISLAAAKAASNQGMVLILLDSEDDCPAELGPALLGRAQTVRADVPYLVALAYREYETWFLASASSLRGHGGLPMDLVAPANPEAIRGAKEWLGNRMPDGYDPVSHQTTFTSAFDLQSARRVPSFERIWTKLSTYFQSP